RLELRHVLADRLDDTGDINAPNTSLGRAESKANEAHQVGLARHHVPVTDVKAGRVNLDEHVVEPDLRLVDLLELEYARRAVAVLNNRPHRCRVTLEFLWGCLGQGRRWHVVVSLMKKMGLGREQAGRGMIDSGSG